MVFAAGVRDLSSVGGVVKVGAHRATGYERNGKAPPCCLLITCLPPAPRPRIFASHDTERFLFDLRKIFFPLVNNSWDFLFPTHLENGEKLLSRFSGLTSKQDDLGTVQ